eukprot:TRINITY_DN1654_c0_g1_i9.p1 TRINITY_DN1654_c0_g1~~TRINITY_DN1654_c0_g1_i9.p1  ORF type:complete len:335 (+),score=71.09 TRINITY_DN1654_c0_g1_i9:97-1101(+)
MARNQEKAQAMLNRLVTMRRMELQGPVETRPFLASECDDLVDCDKWRKQIIKEISKEVTAIQNGSLGEHKIRDLNDHINKLLREKKHWERQIKFLGGPDYLLAQPKVMDGDGKQAMGSDGYYYFGAARELPGVRELFEKIIPDAPKKTRYDLYKLIDPDYYGYRDDDDGLLEKLEKQQEKKLRDEAVRDWKQRNKKRKLADDEEEEDDVAPVESEQQPELFKAHVPLPSQQEIEKMILEKRRQELIAKLQEDEEDEELEQEIATTEPQSEQVSDDDDKEAEPTASTPPPPSEQAQEQAPQPEKAPQTEKISQTEQIGRAVQQECRDRSRMPSSA